jgi:hypothetical protein
METKLTRRGQRGPCPLDAVQPLFHRDRFYLSEPETSPSGQYPVLEVAFVARTRRERFPPSTLCGQFFQLVVSNEFGNCAQPAVHLRGLLVGVYAQTGWIGSFRIVCIQDRHPSLTR